MTLQPPPSTTAQATSEGSVDLIGQLTGQLAATDVDAGETLSYAFSGDNTIDGLTINTDGSWSFDPANAAYNDLAKGEEQTITVDYIVTDASGETDSSSFTINLTGTNDIPVAMSLTMSPQQKTAHSSQDNSLLPTLMPVKPSPISSLALRSLA